MNISLYSSMYEVHSLGYLNVNSIEINGYIALRLSPVRKKNPFFSLLSPSLPSVRIRAGE